MKKRRVFLFFCITVYLAFTGAGQSLPPGHPTECMSNSGSPACQKPVYTDNLSEYLYDLRTSWTFNNGVPDDSGPTVFEGGSAGNLKTQQNDSVSGSDKTEYFIQNPGEAGTFNFGRGNVQNTDIQITGSKKGSNPLGEYLINPPHQGECGDGKANVGDETTCPEDWGTPKVLELDGQPQPSRNLEYHEKADIDRDFTGFPSSVEDLHAYGQSSGTTDYYATNGYIHRQNINITNKTIATEKHFVINPNYGITGDPYDNVTLTKTVYPDRSYTSDPQSFCTDGIDVKDRKHNSVWQDKPDIKESKDQKFYSNSPQRYTALNNWGPANFDIEVTYNEGINLSTGQPLISCTGTTTNNTKCNDGSAPPGAESCNKIDKDITYYGKHGDPQVFDIYPVEFTVSYTDYSIDDDKVWGPVNDEPSIFNDYPQVNVNSTPFGYHTKTSDDGKTGSNDKSVSANRYALHDDRHPEHTGSGYFEAHRIQSKVADADGPDGGNNVLIAYNNETDSIEGATGPLFKTETWENSKTDYIDQSDLPNINCQGNTIRCLKSLDLSTKQSGWPPKTSSYNIEVRK
jgi:hypothetical protein